ncbi:MAG: cation transporter, partial [Candidatus Margulisiibacteriota bacterium]
MTTKAIYVDNMTCEHCVQTIKAALSGIPGVSMVSVNLKEKKVNLTLKESVRDELLKEVIEKAGYHMGRKGKVAKLLKKLSVSVTSDYTWPMHPEIHQIGPGNCPKCGMALEPTALDFDQEEDTSELRNMTKRLFFSSLLTLPLFIITMGDMLVGHFFLSTSSGSFNSLK